MDISILAQLQGIAAGSINGRLIEVRAIDPSVDQRPTRVERIQAVHAADDTLGAGLDTYL
jgi:hypothetical protein